MVESDVEKVQAPKEAITEDDVSDEEQEKLPFANAEIVRLMKQSLAPDKMIRKEVKVAMNKFLEKVLGKICERLDKYPYVMMEYSMFKEAVRPYENMDQWELEKQRVVKYLEKIKADCDHLIFAIQGLE
jgi:histone H3/H4